MGGASSTRKKMIAKPATTRPNPYKSEQARLDSFKGYAWPVPNSKEEIAKSGFYCLKSEDKVRCAFCDVILGDFEVHDIIDDDHKQHAPFCPFIHGLPVGNIPITPITCSEDVYVSKLKTKITGLEKKLEKTKCKICLDREMDTIIFPCCHMMSCARCANQIISCPLCRITISGRVKVYT